MLATFGIIAANSFTIPSEEASKQRAYRTDADGYYRQYYKIPIDVA